MTSIKERLRLIERPVSRAAAWSQALAVFAVPFFVIVIIGHRFGAIDTPSLFWLLGVGGVVLVAAVLTGMRGIYELWVYGKAGGLKSLLGISLASLLLLPFLWSGYLAIALPPLHDISTDLETAPDFEIAGSDRTEGMNLIADLPARNREAQLRAYPQVTARRYPLGSSRVLEEIIDLVADRDWVILASAAEAPGSTVDDEGSSSASSAPDGQLAVPSFRPVPREERAGDNAGRESATVSPVGRDEPATEPLEERYVEAVATSLVLGFESDVVIRLLEEEDGTLVDMRSASRWGPHDLGENARRITSFLADLDTALQGQSQDG